jgi:hypothetical protein
MSFIGEGLNQTKLMEIDHAENPISSRSDSSYDRNFVKGFNEYSI